MDAGGRPAPPLPPPLGRMCSFGELPLRGICTLSGAELPTGKVQYQVLPPGGPLGPHEDVHFAAQRPLPPAHLGHPPRLVMRPADGHRGHTVGSLQRTPRTPGSAPPHTGPAGWFGN